MTPTIITLTGPSCSGKTVLASRLAATGRCEEGVSVTTRERRAGEVNRVHYTFLNREDFDVLEAAGGLLERIEFGGNHYGWPAAEAERITAAGKFAIAVVEPNGARQIDHACRARGWNLLSVFLDTNAELRYRRLLERYCFDVAHATEVPGAGPVNLTATYAKRLAAMAEVERNWGSAWVYDLVIKDFGADTEKAAVAEILRAADECDHEKRKTVCRS